MTGDILAGTVGGVTIGMLALAVAAIVHKPTRDRLRRGHAPQQRN